MAERTQTVARLCRVGVVAVIRSPSSESLIEAARALAEGGVDCIEITMTTPDALRVIADCRVSLGDSVLVGAGSVLSAEVAQQTANAGAEFIVSPVFKSEVLQAAHRCGLACVPGAFSPTEILAATEAGADMVKVFPATKLGPGFFRDILAPMPHLRLTPTGGVDLDTAAEFIKAGAVTLGVGSALVSKQDLISRNFSAVKVKARQFVAVVAAARGDE